MTADRTIPSEWFFDVKARCVVHYNAHLTYADTDMSCLRETVISEPGVKPRRNYGIHHVDPVVCNQLNRACELALEGLTSRLSLAYQRARYFEFTVIGVFTANPSTVLRVAAAMGRLDTSTRHGVSGDIEI